MLPRLPIHDLWLQRLSAHTDGGDRTLDVLAFDDHVLVRLGRLEVVSLSAGSRTPFRVRAVSDEVWALIEGAAACHWLDQRPGSPTHGRSHFEALSQPTAVLVPYGVGFGAIAGEDGATLLRLAAEETDPMPGDEVLDWPETVQ